MPLSDKQLQHRCLVHAGGAQCRYLKNDPKNWQRFNCVKLVITEKKKIDKDVDNYIKKAKASGVNPLQGWSPCGDGGNCKGYPYLPTVLQGYDVKKP